MQVLHVTSPAPREVWQEVLKADPHALVSQTPAWLDCICAIGGYEDASCLYELPGGRQLILPLVRRKYLPAMLTTEASLPHGWGTGGLLAADGVQSQEIATVFTDLVRHPALRTSVRPHPLTAQTWAAALPDINREAHLTHVLDLEGGFEQVWMKRLNTAKRTNIRKAERAGLVVKCDTSGRLVPVFYELYLRWLDRRARERHMPLTVARWLGRLREPLRKFHLVAQAFGQACRIWVAWFNGQPAAAAIMLIYGANAVYWRGASDKELAGPTRANDLLQRLMIEAACHTGCRYYHMGESGGVASLMHFKSRFGARPYQYTEYYLERLPMIYLSEWGHNLIRRAEEHLIQGSK